MDCGIFIKWICRSSFIVVLKRKKDFGKSEVLRAIDGARTRGLDLGKVARYQLRHYRIYDVV